MDNYYEKRAASAAKREKSILKARASAKAAKEWLKKNSLNKETVSDFDALMKKTNAAFEVNLIKN